MTKFGIEIECFNVEQIPDSIPESWAEHDDGSINGHNSLEIVSPPLMVSNESFRQIKDVMKALQEGGARINRSCSMHVHIEVPHNTPGGLNYGKFFSTLVQRYGTLEPFFDSLVPPSRRNNANQWCHSIEALERELERHNLMPFLNSEVDDLMDFSDELHNISRYFKVNLHSYIRHGTVEFRQGGATLNGTKAVAWIKLLVAFFTAAINHSKLVGAREMTATEWADPFFMLDSDRTKQYLMARHEAASNQTVAATDS